MKEKVSNLTYPTLHYDNATQDNDWTSMHS